MKTLNEIDFDSLLQGIDNGGSPLVFCRSCHAPITSQHEQAVIGNNSHHRFTNPVGITYHLRCFTNAHGCSIRGRYTEEHSWFAGYQWQLALCSECGEHLGWYYQYCRSSHSQRFFFGLIADRLMDQMS
ncbi:cereblon family protein [Dasania marina]|uniref:cereblon family protein n=1 Tax=Dasania marina TaxID=471499 RepID=UPI0003639982|nr:cereblon family protein [Dasania marina]